ncbi:hypothetical protein ACLOJK_021979 [Asimina triloba]
MLPLCICGALVILLFLDVLSVRFYWLLASRMLAICDYPIPIDDMNSFQCYFCFQFRVVIVADFVKDKSWPELVPELRSVIENSDLIIERANIRWKTINALTVLQAIIRPFQAFTSICRTEVETERTLLIICKCIYFALTSCQYHNTPKAIKNTPSSMHILENIMSRIESSVHTAMFILKLSELISDLRSPLLPSLCQDLIAILDSLTLDGTAPEDVYLIRLKSGKRSLLIFCALVTRHRKHADM